MATEIPRVKPRLRRRHQPGKGSYPRVTFFAALFYLMLLEENGCILWYLT